MTTPYTNYQYLMYPNNANYPSLTQAEESNPAAEVNNQEELANIVQYIKNLKDADKREEVTLGCI